MIRSVKRTCSNGNCNSNEPSRIYRDGLGESISRRGCSTTKIAKISNTNRKGGNDRQKIVSWLIFILISYFAGYYNGYYYCYYDTENHSNTIINNNNNTSNKDNYKDSNLNINKSLLSWSDFDFVNINRSRKTPTTSPTISTDNAITTHNRNEQKNVNETKYNHNITKSIAAKSSITRKRKKPLKRKDPYWYEPFVENMTRVYEEWPKSNKYGWCIDEQGEKQLRSDELLKHGQRAKGLIYIKSHKASSSTCEGINLSIAHNVAKRKFGDTNSSIVHSKDTSTKANVCLHYNRHEFADERQHARIEKPTLLWTFVRDPVKRDLSHFFHFQVGRFKMSPTDDAVIDFLENRIKGRQCRYLIPEVPYIARMWPKHELRRSFTNVLNVIRRSIIYRYDFIGITERMVESLAVMTALWDLDVTDVIVLSSKRSGGYDDAGHNEQCIKIPKASISPNVQSYLDNKYRYWNGDLPLYHAANRSLDLTIDKIGRPKIEKISNEIRHLQELAEKHCQKEAFFPCSETGEVQFFKAKQSCYVQDAGCGYKCVDNIMRQYREGSLQ